MPHDAEEEVAPLTPAEQAANAHARAALADAVDRRLPEGDRSLMVVVGSGLHRHLPHAKGLRSTTLLQNWKALLEAAYGATVEGGRPWDALCHEDDTATWETMVVEWIRAQDRGTARDAERALNAAIREQITEALAEADAALADLGPRLRAARYHDVATLNFDLALDRALRLAGCGAGLRERSADSHVQYRLRFCIQREGRRLWHPHGVAGHNLRRESIQLGLMGYGETLAALNQRAWEHRNARASFVSEHRDEDAGGYWTPGLHADWVEHVRQNAETYPTWLDRFLTTDVAFVGCGLSRAEVDLWYALHVRQRELLSVPNDERPLAFFVHPEARRLAHIRTGPAGLIPVQTTDHAEAWRLLELGA